MCGSVGLGGDRCDVIELSLYCVGPGVSTRAPTSASEVVDREMSRQFSCQWHVFRAVIEATTNQDHSRSTAVALIGDRGAVGRGQVRHRWSSLRTAYR